MTPQQAPPQQSFLEASFFGPQGSGKTRTSAYLALGISVVLCDKAPVMAWDSEPRWQYLKPIFAAEGVPLIHVPESGFKSLKNSFQLAKREGCCAHVTDQMGAPWDDLKNSFSDETGFIPMHKQNQLRSWWNEMAYEWKSLRMHKIVNGRLGHEYIDYEEDGHVKFMKGDTKMRAGGTESFGYEACLECELSRLQEAEKVERRRKKRMSHGCVVLKDSADILNGREFIFKDLIGGYRPGDFKHVFKAFLPHLEFLAKVSAVTVDKTNSADLVTKQSQFSRQMTEKDIALEKFDALLRLIYPGETAIEKQLRKLCEFNITGTLSRTEFITLKSVLFVKWSAKVMDALRARVIEEGAVPMTEKDLTKQLDFARQDVAAAEKHGDEAFRAQTLMQHKLEGSLAVVRKGPEAFRRLTAETAAEAGR